MSKRKPPLEEYFELDAMAAFVISKFQQGEEAQLKRQLHEQDNEIAALRRSLEKAEMARKATAFKMKELNKSFCWRLADTAGLKIPREDLFNCEDVFCYVQHPGARFVIRRDGYKNLKKALAAAKQPVNKSAGDTILGPGDEVKITNTGKEPQVVQTRVFIPEDRCQVCNGTGRELIDCDGSAGYRQCPACNPPKVIS